MKEHDAWNLVHETIRELAGDGTLPSDLCIAELSSEIVIRDLGIDSVGKVALVSALETKSGVLFAERDLVGLRVLGDLAELLFKTNGEIT